MLGIWLFCFILLYTILAVILWNKRNLYRESLKSGGDSNTILFTEEEELFFVVLCVCEFIFGVYVLLRLMTSDGSEITAGKVIFSCLVILLKPRGVVSVSDVVILLSVNRDRRKKVGLEKQTSIDKK